MQKISAVTVPPEISDLVLKLLQLLRQDSKEFSETRGAQENDYSFKEKENRNEYPSITKLRLAQNPWLFTKLSRGRLT